MANDITNSEDTIDSRDVIERIEELETELTDAHEGEGNAEPFTKWLEETAQHDVSTLQEAARELLALKALAEEASGYAPDWRYGATLIRDSYFRAYAEELADDIGAVVKDAAWPNNFIDWDAAAEALKQDYTAVEFDGETYWVR